MAMILDHGRPSGSLFTRLLPVLLSAVVLLLAGCAGTPGLVDDVNAVAEGVDQHAAASPVTVPSVAVTAPDANGTDANGTDANGTDANGTDANGTDANGTDANGTDANGTDAPAVRAAVVEPLLAAMSVEQRVGQLFMLGFPVDTQGRALRSITPRVTDILQTVQPGGVLLLGLNVFTTDQLLDLVDDLQATAALPLFIAADHEGGAISRITASGHIPATRIPSPHIVGSVADEALAFELGAVMGRELRSLGINMNFAPVADLLTNPENTVIGNRAYGSDPHLVGDLVAALVRGMQSERLASVLKHFPGHGDTFEDTHYEAAVVRHSLERLAAVELVPFERGIQAGAMGVMTAHIGAPEITGSGEPATLSPMLLQRLLRENLGFGGLVVSDSLNMHALTRYYDRNDVVVQAFLAGVDLLLHPERPTEAYQAMVDAVHSGRIPMTRLDESVRRVLEAKYELGLLGPGLADGPNGRAADLNAILGAPLHRAVVEEIVRRHNQVPDPSTH